MMEHDTLLAYLDQWASEKPDTVWLKDLRDDGSDDYSWAESRRQVRCVAAALEARFEKDTKILLLSRNRAHWFFADLAIMASGNVSVGLFTTLNADVAHYIAQFTQARAIFVGEADNWESVKAVLSDDTCVISLPGVEIPEASLTWDQLLSEGAACTPSHVPRHDDTIALIFTSGTTGRPKGVIQTNDSNVIPIRRGSEFLEIEAEPIYFSYLPLSHLAERQVIEFTSLCRGAPVSFNEGLEFLGRDMQRTRPTFFFGAPRVWEQFQQAVLAQFGGADAFDRALLADPQVVSSNVKAALGLDRCAFHLTGSAPLPMPLMAWWDSVGIALMEGFGQTEAMSLIISREGQRRLGALGKPLPGVDIKITEAGELAIRADGCTPGYYKQPDKTAELIQDGWLHTGDRFRQDQDGFLYITGRIKDYFKTIHGKFVAPTPIEALFAENLCVEQQCLVGMGMAKTVMIAVVSESMRATPPEAIEVSVTSTIRSMNASLEKHARVAGVILTYTPWTIESGVLTPTLKIKRDQIADRFGDAAAAMATESAEKKQILVRWR